MAQTAQNKTGKIKIKEIIRTGIVNHDHVIKEIIKRHKLLKNKTGIINHDHLYEIKLNHGH
jgi:hypothetical protein